MDGGGGAGGVDLLDFVLVAGDERTDEDMFDVLRVSCCWLCVGGIGGGGSTWLVDYGANNGCPDNI